MKRKSMEITDEQVWAEWDRLMGGTEPTVTGGITTRDLANRMGIHYNSAFKRIKKLLDQGLVRRIGVRIKHHYRVPVYDLVSKTSGDARKPRQNVKGAA